MLPIDFGHPLTDAQLSRIQELAGRDIEYAITIPTQPDCGRPRIIEGPGMLLLNFGHPLTDAQLSRVRELVGQGIERTITVPTQFDHARPFDQQVRELLATVPLTPEQWQTTPLIINPPSLAPITAVLLAELHGRIGYFPAVLRLRSVANTMPPQFEVAELLNLQAIRDAARARRA